MTKFIDGPLWYFALAVFVVGVIWRLIAIFRAGIGTDLSVPKRSAFGGALMTTLRRFAPRHEMAPRIRFHVVAGYMFHLGLFAVLLFAAPHVLFLQEHLLGFRQDGLGACVAHGSSNFAGGRPHLSTTDVAGNG